MEDMEALPVRFPSRQHNHSSCVNKLLGDAEEECRRQKLRFTEHRRKVLEIIASSHKPLGAYDILEQMNFSGRRQAPVVAYRALDFLINLGLVHRLNSLNAFVACMAVGEDHTAQFLICRQCKNVGELNSNRFPSGSKRMRWRQDFRWTSSWWKSSASVTNVRSPDDS